MTLTGINVVLPESLEGYCEFRWLLTDVGVKILEGINVALHEYHDRVAVDSAGFWDDASTPQNETWLGQCYRARHDRLYVGVPLLGALSCGIQYPSRPSWISGKGCCGCRGYLNPWSWLQPRFQANVKAEVMSAMEVSRMAGVDDGRDTSPGASQRRG